MKTIALGLQHTFVMFGATVLVPLLTGLEVSVALFASGVGTLLFHVVTKFKVPVYLGSSFAFIPAILAISTAEGGSLSLACGGVAVAGTVYVVVALIVRRFSVSWIYALLPAHITGTIIVLIGLILAPVAVRNAGGGPLADSIGKASCLGIAALTLAVAVIVKIYLRRQAPFVSMLGVLIALTTGYLFCLSLGLVDVQAISSASWFGYPAFSAPEFQVAAILTALPYTVVTLAEHIGDVLAIGNVVGKDFIKEPGLHRTLIGDGVATTVSALMGGPANTTYSENTGTVALTEVHDPKVMRIAAIFAILLSFMPKVSAIIATIPPPVVGGISILLFGMIAAIGIKTFAIQGVELGNPKVLIITSTMLVLGIGGAEVELGAVKLGGLSLAIVVGILLNLLLRE